MQYHLKAVADGRLNRDAPLVQHAAGRQTKDCRAVSALAG
jgi:hypothetical protein